MLPILGIKRSRDISTFGLLCFIALLQFGSKLAEEFYHTRKSTFVSLQDCHMHHNLSSVLKAIFVKLS